MWMFFQGAMCIPGFKCLSQAMFSHEPTLTLDSKVEIFLWVKKGHPTSTQLSTSFTFYELCLTFYTWHIFEFLKIFVSITKLILWMTYTTLIVHLYFFNFKKNAVIWVLASPQKIMGWQLNHHCLILNQWVKKGSVLWKGWVFLLQEWATYCRSEFVIKTHNFHSLPSVVLF